MNNGTNPDLIESAAETTIPELHPDVAESGVKVNHPSTDMAHVVAELNTLTTGASPAGHDIPISTNPAITINSPTNAALEAPAPQTPNEAQVGQEADTPTMLIDKKRREEMAERKLRRAA